MTKTVLLANGKRWFCLRDFSSVSGSEEHPFVFVGRMEIVIFAIFRQTHLFSVGLQNTVFQKHRFHNPDYRARGNRALVIVL